MSDHNKKQPQIDIDGCIEFISKFAYDFEHFTSVDQEIPAKLSYKIAAFVEPRAVLRSVRQAVLEEIQPVSTPLKKFAFDTRRYDQETIRNPRANLQNWVRSDQFIDDEMQNKINIFSKLVHPMEELKTAYGAQPEWHESYARVLYDHLIRVLRVKQADLDIFRPQLAYLEQLMFARYRLSMEELARIKESEFKEHILKKDESLLKRGVFLHLTGGNETQVKQSTQLAKDGNGLTQESIVNAIFGNNGFRHEGEKTVERTITITIKDQVIE